MRSGITYFHYPVAYDPESVQEMVDNFPTLCSMIDKGRFYIACAQGLHRTDVAFCIYWMLYGADRGKAQPELRGYLEVEGRDLLRVNQCLNGFFRRSVEKNGVELIPMRVFKERKEMIKAAWESPKDTPRQ